MFLDNTKIQYDKFTIFIPHTIQNMLQHLVGTIWHNDLATITDPTGIVSVDIGIARLDRIHRAAITCDKTNLSAITSPGSFLITTTPDRTNGTVYPNELVAYAWTHHTWAELADLVLAKQPITKLRATELVRRHRSRRAELEYRRTRQTWTEVVVPDIYEEQLVHRTRVSRETHLTNVATAASDEYDTLDLGAKMDETRVEYVNRVVVEATVTVSHTHPTQHMLDFYQCYRPRRVVCPITGTRVPRRLLAMVVARDHQVIQKIVDGHLAGMGFLVTYKLWHDTQFGYTPIEYPTSTTVVFVDGTKTTFGRLVDTVRRDVGRGVRTSGVVYMGNVRCKHQVVAPSTHSAFVSEAELSFRETAITPALRFNLHVFQYNKRTNTIREHIIPRLVVVPATTRVAALFDRSVACTIAAAEDTLRIANRLVAERTQRELKMFQVRARLEITHEMFLKSTTSPPADRDVFVNAVDAEYNRLCTKASQKSVRSQKLQDEEWN
jgi:hypothetical protein